MDPNSLFYRMHKLWVWKLKSNVLKSTPFSKERHIYISRLDFDLAFRLLTECAKLNIDHLSLILSLSLSCNYLPVRTNKSSIEKPTTFHEKNNLVTNTSNTPNIVQKIGAFLHDGKDKDGNDRVKTGL